uniref:Mitochondrial import inner membrane translocase subunit n=2 Tax=Wuchereria bancrofti TaxID=6293 RepID=A0A1I8ESR4_WUCBA
MPNLQGQESLATTKKAHFLPFICFDVMEQILDVESLKKLTPEQQKTLISGVKQQAAILNAQNMVTDLSERCLTKCITSPGSTLSNTERQCLQRCMDRFMETYNLVSQTLQKRVQEEIATSTRMT